jgi:hypothetical protein
MGRFLNYIIVFTFLLSFEVNSIHTDDYDFNREHKLIGIEYQYNDFGFGYQEFINSFYRKSKAFNIRYIFNDNFSINFFKTTGYDFKYALLPGFSFSYENIIIEITHLPNVHESGVGHVVLISKKVKF